MRSMISRGLSCEQVVGPRPQPSSAPGRKFSISTSASATSWRTMSCASGCLQVQRHRALVARLHLPPDRGAVLEQPPVAQRVAPRAAGRRLDLDHVGAEVGQRLGGERAGDQLAQFQHLEAVQGPGGHCAAARLSPHPAAESRCSWLGLLLVRLLGRRPLGDDLVEGLGRLLVSQQQVEVVDDLGLDPVRNAASRKPSCASSTNLSLVTFNSPWTPVRLKLTTSEVLPSS